MMIFSGKKLDAIAHKLDEIEASQSSSCADIKRQIAELNAKTDSVSDLVLLLSERVDAASGAISRLCSERIDVVRGELIDAINESSAKMSAGVSAVAARLLDVAAETKISSSAAAGRFDALDSAVRALLVAQLMNEIDA